MKGWMSKAYRFSHGARGFSTLEALVAVGILAVAIVSGGFQVNSGMNVIKRMRRGQIVDGLEFSLYTLLARDDVLTSSIQKSGNTELIKCINSNGCKASTYSGITFYVPGTSQAITGSGVYYNQSGQSLNSSPCNGKTSCKEDFYQIITSVRTNCAGKASCTAPSGVTIGFSIIDAKAVKLASGEIDRVLASGSLIAAMNVGCGTDAVLQGVGLDGSPLCVAKNKIEFIDKKVQKVEPFDCRGKKKDPKNPSASQPDDQFFVEQVKASKISCGKSFWNE